MGPQDWAQCRSILSKHVHLYYAGWNLRVELACIIIVVAVWWRFGFTSAPGITGIAAAIWIAHKGIQSYAIKKALTEGYEMGFEAGQLAAKGISLEQHNKHLQTMIEIA